jgi:hypothetical protein
VDFFSTRPIAARARGRSRVDAPLDWVLETVFATPGVLARRDLVTKLGGFDPELVMFEDLDLLARLALCGPFGVDSKPLIRLHRRGPAGQSLSERCAASPGHGARSLAKVYAKLLLAPGLPPTERETIRRKLSAQRADVAVVERAEREWLASLGTFCRSIADCPSFASSARAAVGIVAGARGVAWVRQLRHGEQTAAFTR